MEFTTLDATTRDTGKRAARNTRLQGMVPCVLYGRHVEPLSFQMDGRYLEKLVRSNETPLVQIELEGKSWDCILKDTDFHPVNDDVIHADFQVLQKGEKITLSVPFRFEGTPVGQINGGNAQHVISEVEISCLPKDIPSHLTIDVSGLDIGDSIHIGDLSFENVDFQTSTSQTVVMVHAPRIAAVEEVEETEEGAEEATEEEAAE
ncbi:MAG: 50S ribosomal protein L25 [Rhodothermales bacterium]